MIYRGVLIWNWVHYWLCVRGEEGRWVIYLCVSAVCSLSVSCSALCLFSKTWPVQGFCLCVCYLQRSSQYIGLFLRAIPFEICRGAEWKQKIIKSQSITSARLVDTQTNTSDWKWHWRTDGQTDWRMLPSTDKHLRLKMTLTDGQTDWRTLPSTLSSHCSHFYHCR